MPPGDVPSSSVTQGRPVPPCSSQAKPAQSTISPTVPSATMPSQRGAVCRNSRLKRTPRLTPITSCAAFISHCGTADSSMPAMVSPMETMSAPRNQGLARLSHSISSAPAPVASASQAKPGHCTMRMLGAVRPGSPCKPAHCRANGIVTVTITSRRLWLAATRSVRACSRSASSVISEAAPIAPEKYVVARSRSSVMPGSCSMPGACTRYSQRPKAQPRSNAQAMASAMAHHRPATSAVTAGVKYRPKAPPIVHCPRLRSQPQLCVGAPAIETSDTEINGPSIHGSGVCSIRHSCAASQASSKVAAA